MNWFWRFMERLQTTTEKVVAPILEDKYELVHMAANNRWYAVVNGKPLKWDMVSGSYKTTNYWEYAERHESEFWAQHAIDTYKKWHGREVLEVKEAK